MMTRALRIAIVTICVLATTAVADAQIARWIIRPVNQAISRMSGSHFKAWNDEKCGVFNSDGKQVVPFMADSITDFVNDCAVVLRMENDRWRLLSVLHASGTLYPVREQVYVDENPFVASDRLLVTDKKHKDLFIDLQGAKLKDKVDRTVLPAAGAEPDLEFHTDGPVPFEAGEVYGYRMDHDVLLPAQFPEAYPFSAGYAIATDHTGRYGLLRLLTDDVKVTQTEGAATITDYSKAAVDFKVHVPIEFDNEIITLTCTDTKGNELEEKSYMGGSERVVPFMLPGGKHTVRVLQGDLLLYSTTITAVPKPKPSPKKPASTTPAKPVQTTRGKVTASTVSAGNLQLMVGASSLKANAKDCASFTITVTNNSAEPVSSVLAVSGKGVVCNTSSVTVNPHSSRSVTATFTGIKGREQRTVTVRAANRSTTKTITVNPFFTEF